MAKTTLATYKTVRDIVVNFRPETMFCYCVNDNLYRITAREFLASKYYLGNVFPYMFVRNSIFGFPAFYV